MTLAAFGTRFLPFVAAVQLLAGGPVQAVEDMVGNPEYGRKLAQEWCADCHRVEPDQAGTSIVGAPSFRDRANESDMTALSLRVFLRTSHPEMPNIRLTPEQTDDIVAYIISLKSN